MGLQQGDAQFLGSKLGHSGRRGRTQICRVAGVGRVWQVRALGAESRCRERAHTRPDVNYLGRTGRHL